MSCVVLKLQNCEIKSPSLPSLQFSNLKGPLKKEMQQIFLSNLNQILSSGIRARTGIWKSITGEFKNGIKIGDFGAIGGEWDPQFQNWFKPR